MAEWQKTQISEFLKERVGRYKPNDPAVVNLKRLDKIDFSGKMHFSDKSTKTDMIIVKKGDLVISGINVAKGALAVYDGEEDITATIHYSTYQFDDEKIDVEYFKRFLKSPKFIQLLKSQVKGGIKTEIKPKHLLPLKINLPDLDTQKSIADFFKRTENDIYELSNEINHQQSFIKQLRQSILQEAVEGKLTAQWRKQHPELISGENHAARLLEKIKAEREKLAKNAKSTKKFKELPPVSEEEKPFELPEGWVWTRLGKLINPLRGITYGIIKLGVEPKSGGVFTLRTSDVKFRYIDISKTRKVRENISNNFKRTILQGGEILINVRGTLGGCAIVPDELRGFNVSREVSVVPLQIVELNKHILNVVSSPYFNTEIKKNLRGIAYKGLNLNLLSLLLVPLPPLLEQQVISQKVNKLMAKINALEEQVKNGKAQAEQLMQAVLREAFNGEE